MANRRRRWLLIAMVGAGLAALAVFVYWPPDEETRPPATTSAPLPALTTSSFLNTRPEVAYVGDQQCVSCHRDYSRSYRQHPMGRSLCTVADAPRLESYDERANTHFQSGPFHFQSERRGTRLIQKEWCQDPDGNVVAKQEVDIDYVIGSGAHAVAYLWQRDGFLFESPITFYTGNSKWGLSPGYEVKQSHFTRPIPRRCLYCHCDKAHAADDDSINRYRDPPFRQLAIGCERCHGPGELHVAARKKAPLAEEVDNTIVNPKHLSPTLREAVCQQCHLQGEAIIERRGRSMHDFRPGLPLHEYSSVFVKPQMNQGNRLVGHFEQMHQSACFTRSAGNFGCTSCHDPHEAPPHDQLASHYRERCMECHRSEPPAKAKPRTVAARLCSVPLAERKDKKGVDNCIGCHMPTSASAEVSHVALTDHRVLRNPARSPDGPPTPPSSLVPFHPDLHLDDPEVQRDQALALVHFLTMVPDAPGEFRAAVNRQVLELLDDAVKRAPDDLPAQEARVAALFELGHEEEALQAAREILAKTPRRQSLLAAAAFVAQVTGKLDEAERYARRLIEFYPRNADYYHRLARICSEKKAWPQAIIAADQSLRVNPFDGAVRGTLITALLEDGQRDRALAELKTLSVIDPTQHKRNWDEYQRRSEK